MKTTTAGTVRVLSTFGEVENLRKLLFAMKIQSNSNLAIRHINFITTITSLW